MHIEAIALSVAVVAAATVAVPLGEPLVCNLQALSSGERDRHLALGQKLKQAVVRVAELPNGWELTLDVQRMGRDAKGQPYCVVEIAEWADLESRCCPFLDFGIGLEGRSRLLKLRLTGGPGVKEFLKDEFGLA